MSKPAASNSHDPQSAAPESGPLEAGSADRPMDSNSDSWQEWVDGAIPSGETWSPPAAPMVPLLRPTTLVQPPVALVETAFLASTTSLLWLINFYFPLGPIWRICFPIPIALVYLRWNLRAAWMATVVSSLLLTVFMGPVRSLFFLMPSGLLGVLFGCCWRRGAGWGLSIFLGTIINTIGFFFRVALTSVLLGEDLWIYVTTQVTKLISWVSIRLGLLIQPDLQVVQILAVVLVVINGLIYLFAVHLAAWFLLKRLGLRVPDPPNWVQVMLELETE